MQSVLEARLQKPAGGAAKSGPADSAYNLQIKLAGRGSLLGNDAVQLEHHHVPAQICTECRRLGGRGGAAKLADVAPLQDLSGRKGTHIR